jgi:dihydropteroate synthase
MGILNITPDSFFDGGRYNQITDTLKQCEKMIAEGADFIDVGAYSSRPGAEDIPEEEEWMRLKPAIESIKKEFPHALLSVDTFRSPIARMAVEQGVDIINDISGGQADTEMFKTIAKLKVPYVIMHMRGTPQTMTHLTSYDNLLKEIINYFHATLYTLTQLGITDVIIDPGFGFAKTVDQNFELLSNLNLLHILDKPLLVGLSRKSMIWRTLLTTPEQAANGTTVLNTIALTKGVSILRVHDVKEAKEIITLFNKLNP